jgi:hypothetical protein
MAMSPAEAYAVWIDHVTKAMHFILDSFKDGVFKNEINEKMSITTMFNVMLESSVVTAEQKKILRLGRDLTAPFRGPLVSMKFSAEWADSSRRLYPSSLKDSKLSFHRSRSLNLTVRLILLLRWGKMVGLLQCL